MLKEAVEVRGVFSLPNGKTSFNSLLENGAPTDQWITVTFDNDPTDASLVRLYETGGERIVLDKDDVTRLLEVVNSKPEIPFNFR